MSTSHGATPARDGAEGAAPAQSGGAKAQPWHARSPDDVLAALRSRREGLDPEDVQARFERHGPNALPQPAPPHPLRRLLRQFNNLFIYVLLGAAVISGVLGEVVDALVILLVVLANAVIGYIQEGRAENALEAIRKMVAASASVVRNGRREAIDAAELVPGDIVLLEAGERVPADCRVLRANNLTIGEAVLTGESAAVEKRTAPVNESAALADRSGMAYSGTMIATGHGMAVVTATGGQTEIGRISGMIGHVEQLQTPLLRQMDQFARQLTIVTLVVAVAIGVLALTLRGYAASETFMLMVGLAVAAIPEGLPAVMTITLAIGVQRMAARNGIIRRLPAVETLGSVSLICSDKTGTLTRNEMTVTRVALADRELEVTGVGYEPHGAIRTGGSDIDAADHPRLLALTRACALCNDAELRRDDSVWTVVGDPIEGAMLALASKAGHEPERLRREYPRTDEIPFDAQHRFMATLHHTHDGGAFVYVKGAPERLLEMCSGQLGPHGTAPLEADGWLERVERLAAEGLRVLTVAIKEMPSGARSLRFEDLEDGVILVGLVGVIDPPRAEAIEAVAACREAGVGVKMITGDHPVTAGAIAAQLGLDGASEVATGRDVDSWGEDELAQRAAVTGVFARTTPEHKLRLVTALQSGGSIVAMTGDGVNDAPALKRADIGIAMGRTGSEAAKEAAEMVLADDNFASIVAAVREGRTVYDNLKKVIGWTLPTNGGEALIIILAVMLGFTLPITPVQILWINMVTAIALGLALAFEPTEPAAMRRPPRPHDEPLLTGFLIWRVGFVSLLFVAGAFGMFFWALDTGRSLVAAQTIVVNTIVVMEIFYLFSVRYVHGTSLTWQGVVGTRAVVISVIAVTLAQFAFTYLGPMQALFGSAPLGVADGLRVVGVGVALLLTLEVEKRVQQLFFSSKQ